jgi:NAD(P)H-hydrate repair Nnr-like enzyme with NAD(P)H-hydrate dehydratase domain
VRSNLLPLAEIPSLPTRATDANKGDCGRVVVIGGSRGMAGAPCLAARAACRAGSGLVLVAVPKAIWDVVAMKLDEAQTRGVGDDDDATFTEWSSLELLKICDWADVVVMGPGMSQHIGTIKAVHELVDKCEKP